MSARGFSGNGGLNVVEPDFPVSRVLRALGPERTFVLAMVVYVLVPWLWVLHDGTIASTDAVRGLTSPENNYIYVLPFLFGAVAYYFRDSVFLVPRLIARGVISAPSPSDSASSSTDATESAVEHVVKAVSASRLARLARPVPLIVAVVVPVLFLMNGAPQWRPPILQSLLASNPYANGWLFEHGAIRPVAFFFSFTFHGVGMAVLTVWAISHLRAARVIARLLADDSVVRVDLKILHPDRCMGLLPISDLVRHSAVVLLLISLTVFLWSAGKLLDSGVDILSDAGFRSAWAMYLVLAPLLFFAPLASARRRMWVLREETLATLGRQIQDANTTDEAAKSDTYRMVLGASVWPFTFATLSSFIASLGVPLLITALSELIVRLLKTP